MHRRKAISILVFVVVISSAAVLCYHSLFPTPPDQETEEPAPLTAMRHPFNSLDWWDIPFELGDIGDIMLPLETFNDFGNRFDGTAGYQQAAEYVIDYLTGLGLNTSYWGPHLSVVGYQRGYGNDSRAIVFGAHLDGPEVGVGIDQNAGGCAVVITIASILSHYRLPIDIYYAFFSGNMEFLDEQKTVRALYGSREVSAILKSDNVDVIAMYNFDEILYRSHRQPDDHRLVAEHYLVSSQGYHRTKYLADLLNTFMRRSGENIMTVRESVMTDTDHTPFWDQGFPAVNVKSGHQIDPEMPPQDTPRSPDYNRTQALWVARAAACVAVFLGMQGNGQATTQKIEAFLTPGESTVLRSVMTMEQSPTLSGIVAPNSTLSITMTDSSGDTILSSVVDSNFTTTTDQDAAIGPLNVLIRNTGDTNSSFTVYLTYEQDTDGDSVPDSEQYSWPPPDPPLDWDGDGLSDDEERVYHTDIFLPDTDGDGISDYVEVVNGMDPLRDDAQGDIDRDGIPNYREIEIGTSPVSNDTDADGMPDPWEISYGINPLVDDAQMDPDGDGLTNIEEFTHGADPLSSDGDHDLVPDLMEVQMGLDPLSDDTDDDGLNDFLELENGLNPLNPDCDGDFVPDGVDPNPKVSEILILLLISLVPISVGSVILWRRIR